MQAQDPERILLVRLSHLGDVCHALPVFHALRASYPAAELAWAIQPEFAPLLDGLPGLGRLFLFQRRGGFAAWPALRRELRAWGPDLAVDAMGNWKSAMVTLVSGAGTRVGLNRRDWREPTAALAMTRRASPAPGPHAVERALHLARCVAPAPGPPRWDLPLSPDERSDGLSQLAALLPDRGRPRRLLHLAAPGDPRSLPLASFAALAEGFSRAGEDWLALSGPAEESVGEELARRLPAESGRAHLVGQRGLRELAALLAAAGSEGVRILSCDSGPCHVAAAVGAAVDLVAGPQDPALTGPWPVAGTPRSPHRVHRAPGPQHELASWDPDELLTSLAFPPAR